MYSRIVFLTIINCILLFNSTLAQITVSQSNLELIFGLGQQAYLYSDTTDTTFQVDIGAPGGPNTYDFNGLQFTPRDTTGAVLANEFEELINRYPQDAIAFRTFTDQQTNTSEYFIFRLVTKGFLSLGDALLSPLLNRFTHFVPEELIVPFPMNFGYDTTFSVVEYDTSFIDGVPVITNSSTINVRRSFDGWGTLILPGLGSFDCLRYRQLDLHPSDSKSFLFLMNTIDT